MAFTEEQLREMERAVMARNLAPPADMAATPTAEPMVSRQPAPPAGPMASPGIASPQDLPDAAPLPEDDPGRPLTREELQKYGAKPKEQDIALRANATDDKTAPTSPARDPSWTPESEKGGPPKKPKEPAPHYEEEDDAGASAPASPGHLVPGGMDPYTEKRDAKYGKQVAPGVRDAIGQAGRLQMEAGDRERAANAQLFQREHDAALSKVAANETAMAQQQRLAEDRDRMVSARLAEIEMLNKKAQGNPEDLWSAPHVLGRMAGFLMLTLGTVTMATGGKGSAGAAIGMAMAGKFVDGLINQDMQHKIDERNQAGKAAGRQINLLHLHEERMGNQKKAIDATKMAYYDNVLQQMEAYKADHAGQVNESNYLNLQAQILKQQADTANRLGIQEQADVTDELVNKWRKPTMVGGTPGRNLQDVGNTITLGDKTTWALGSGPQADQAVKSINAMQSLTEINSRMRALRKKAYGLDPTSEQYAKVYGELTSLGSQKAPLMSVALDGSSIRKDERAEIEKNDVKATEGLGVPGVPFSNKIPVYSRRQQLQADAVIDSQLSLWEHQQRILASQGRQVKRGYTVDASGEKHPVASYTGRDAAPVEHLPPESFDSDDPSEEDRPKRERPLSESTPRAPSFGRQDLPTPAGHHGRKKKEK